MIVRGTSFLPSHSVTTYIELKDTGHEVLSGIILDKLVKIINIKYPRKCGWKLFIQSIYAVMFHHYALIVEKE